MKFFFISLNLFFLLSIEASDKVVQAPWQQRVDCEIDVRLHPETKTLSAFISIHYYNNSPDTLRSIWMHIWPNAYKNNQTAFARQELQKGKTDFHFSKDNEKGDISGLSFRSGGQDLKWQPHPEHIDILELKLDKPLMPGEDIVITTPFNVKLPKIVSRGGYSGDFFSVTQWYPKPAVYDVNGWNAMPYLDQGEFYSEFGNYRVNITLPDTWQLASGGHLIEQKQTMPQDSVASTSYTYAENNIHDFAWFAFRGFSVSSRSISVGGDDSVRLFVYMMPDTKSKQKHQPMYYLDKGVTGFLACVLASVPLFMSRPGAP